MVDFNVIVAEKLCLGTLRWAFALSRRSGGSKGAPGLTFDARGAIMTVVELTLSNETMS